MDVKLTLSRRNLMTLLAKLDAVKEGGESFCTIIKSDTIHPEFPLTGSDNVFVTAVEDEEYYKYRNPGKVLHLNEGGNHE